MSNSLQKKRKSFLIAKDSEDTTKKPQKSNTETQDAIAPREHQQTKDEKAIDDFQVSDANTRLLLSSDANKSSRNCLIPLTFKKQKQTKKFVLKGSIGIPKIPIEYRSVYWHKLSETTKAILSQVPIHYTLEELYAAVEGLLVLNSAKETYDNLETLITSHLKNEHQFLLSKVTANVEYKDFLTDLNLSWTKHCQQIKFINNIFLPLDRRYVILSGRTIWDVSMDLYKDNISIHSSISKSTISGILRLIELRRKSEFIELKTFHSLIHMLLTLNLYRSTFEQEFLDATKQFYIEKSKSNIMKCQDSIETYLSFVEKCLNDEFEFTVNYLDSKSNEKLIPIIEKALIIDHIDEILCLNYDHFVSQNNYEHLNLLYNLFKRVDRLEQLRKKWNNYIKQKGTELVKDSSQKKKLIKLLLKWKSQLDKVLENCFQKDNDFVYATKEALETALNSISYLPAKLLAKHLNQLLVKQTEEFEHKLNKVIQLFCLLNNKDVFEAFARKDLAKRLLYQLSSSSDAEILTILKLKHECGPQYTAKMDEMFKDIELSKTLSSQFEKQLSKNKVVHNKITPLVNVLTMGQWPTFPLLEVTLPVEFSMLQEAFTNFHKKRFNGRHLFWVHTHGQATLKAKFAHTKKELHLSFFQCWVLLLFNTHLKLHYSDIKHFLGLNDEEELKRTISSLIYGKHKILIRDSPEEQNANDLSKLNFSDNDCFQLNLEFNCPNYRVKLNQIQLKDTKSEQVQIQENVLQNRVYMVDAAIVRIMKTKKTMKHAEFIAELMNILKFPINVTDLKKQIEIMIQRDFLSRDPNDSSVYHYVA